MSQLRIRRKTPMVLSREQEVLIERMMDEWEEEQSDAKLRAEIEADKEL